MQLNKQNIMKTPFKIILLALLVLASCSGSKTGTRHDIGEQNIIVSSVVVSKYSYVTFVYRMPIPEGHIDMFVRSVPGEGYYYKRYDIERGDTLRKRLVLVEYEQEIWLEEVSIEEHIIN